MKRIDRVDRKDFKKIKEDLKIINSFGTTWYSRTCYCKEDNRASNENYSNINKGSFFSS